MPRGKSFIYIVEVEGKESLVKSVSKGRAVKAVLAGITVRRASPVEVADYLGSGVELIDATKEESNAANTRKTHASR